MLSSVQIKNEAGEVLTSLKLSTGAMVRLERQFDGASIGEVMQRLERGSFDVVASVVTQAMNDGKGGDEAYAFDLIDQAGGPIKVAKFVGEAVKIAFPEATPEEQADGEGKSTKASRKK